MGGRGWGEWQPAQRVRQACKPMAAYALMQLLTAGVLVGGLVGGWVRQGIGGGPWAWVGCRRLSPRIPDGAPSRGTQSSRRGAGGACMNEPDCKSSNKEEIRNRSRLQAAGWRRASNWRCASHARPAARGGHAPLGLQRPLRCSAHSR